MACKTPRSISASLGLLTLASNTSRARSTTLRSDSVGDLQVCTSVQNDWKRTNVFRRANVWNPASANSSLKSISNIFCDEGLHADALTCLFSRLLHRTVVAEPEDHASQAFRSVLGNLRNWMTRTELHSIQHRPWHFIRCNSKVSSCKGCLDKFLAAINSYAFIPHSGCPHCGSADETKILWQWILCRNLHDVAKFTDPWQSGGGGLHMGLLTNAAIQVCSMFAELGVGHWTPCCWDGLLLVELFYGWATKDRPFPALSPNLGRCIPRFM